MAAFSTATGRWLRAAERSQAKESKMIVHFIPTVAAPAHSPCTTRELVSSTKLPCWLPSAQTYRGVSACLIVLKTQVAILQKPTGPKGMTRASMLYSIVCIPVTTLWLSRNDMHSNSKLTSCWEAAVAPTGQGILLLHSFHQDR